MRSSSRNGSNRMSMTCLLDRSVRSRGELCAARSKRCASPAEEGRRRHQRAPSPRPWLPRRARVLTRAWLRSARRPASRSRAGPRPRRAAVTTTNHTPHRCSSAGTPKPCRKRVRPGHIRDTPPRPATPARSRPQAELRHRGNGHATRPPRRPFLRRASRDRRRSSRCAPRRAVAVDGHVGDTASVDNAWIADRLEAFASLLDLADANPYTPRAYLRAAETIRGAPVPVAGLVQSGRVRRLRGIGPGIEGRLRELVETGEIAELAELERELSPELVGLGRYLGLGATRSLEIARALGVRTAGELREAAAAGRLRTVPGIGPKREAQLLDALAREGEPRPQRGLLLNRAWELVGGVAAALGGEAAGDVRRWRDSCEHLAVVCAAPDPGPVLDRFAELPQIVAVVEQDERAAVGVTVEGVPVELVAAEPERFGTALVRATGSTAYVAALGPLPDAPGEAALYAALGVPWCPPELREQAFRSEPPAL